MDAVMEKLEKEDNAGSETEEEFPDDFQCCVCLDLFYKPVVLGCGHIACFWCVFKAMDSWKESHCPVCRHSYNHFPSICNVMHFLLLKLYPLAYKRRERQVLEEEKKLDYFSPQFDDYLSASKFGGEFDTTGSSSAHSTSILNEKLHLESGLCEGESSLIKDSTEIIVLDKDYTISTPSYQTITNVAAPENTTPGDKLANGTCKPVLITDLLCALCKQLVFQPVVLNCGHVYCKACIISPGNKVCICQVCKSIHPNGFPNVCLVLEHFLEEQFPEEYASRKETLLKPVCQQGSPSTCSTQAQQKAGKRSLPPRNSYASLLFGRGPKVHAGVGCDYCGMCPIIGERFKCKDCTEKIGFDLCEGCYKSSSKLPGRFNQQHKPDHKFEIVTPYLIDTLMLRLGAEHSVEHGSNDPEYLELEAISRAPNSSNDAPIDVEEGVAAPIPSTDTFEDREVTDSES